MGIQDASEQCVSMSVRARAKVHIHMARQLWVCVSVYVYDEPYAGGKNSIYISTR